MNPKPEEVSMMAAALDLAHSDMTVVSNGVLTRVHLRDACVGRKCWVHGPSESHMQFWPVTWRADKRTAERLCSHQIGHPDPDDLEHNANLGRDVSAHTCDGCCEDS